MKKAPIKDNEAERLAELESYDVLDSESEMSYDDITFLASQICNKPIALVSLIDSDRQWFKSKQGLDAPETPRDVSFCGHAIHEQEIFEIRDARQDERFSDNPLVTGAPKVIFYAGAQLVTPSGHNIGTLCVIDHEASELTEDQRKTLKILAHQVVELLELRKSNQSLKQSLATIEQKDRELYQQKKLASLGSMASGIAHEINNPLAIIKGNLSLVQKKIKHVTEDKKIELPIDKSLENINRIETIVRGMLDFTRTNSEEKKSICSVFDLVNESQSRIKEKFEAIEQTIDSISFFNQVDPGLKVKTHSTQIIQILNNLLKNAVDALLTQSNQNPAIQNKKVYVSANQVNEQIEIFVRDTGPGVPSEKIDSLVEPFYTTKDTGQGTGLGLSICQGLAQANGGDLFFRNHPEGGLEVKLALPAISSNAESSQSNELKKSA